MHMLKQLLIHLIILILKISSKKVIVVYYFIYILANYITKYGNIFYTH